MLTADPRLVDPQPGRGAGRRAGARRARSVRRPIAARGRLSGPDSRPGPGEHLRPEPVAGQEVEAQITVPIERAIVGLPKLQPLRSISKFGLSQVVVTFDDSVGIYFARQLISERLLTVQFPANVTERPQLGPVATGLGEVFHYTLSSPTRSLTELRTLQDWTLRPRLRTVPGVAEVNGWGGAQRQYVVRADPDRLQRFGTTLDQLLSVPLADGNRNAGGGRINGFGVRNSRPGSGADQAHRRKSARS